MNLQSMSFFQLASQRMQWLGARQQVVSENIANADTPGFKAREVAPFSEMVAGARSGARSGGVARTHAAHITGGGAAAGVRVTADEAAWEQSLDGNSVVLEQQTVKASEIGEGYRLAAQLYGKGHQILALAVSRQR